MTFVHSKTFKSKLQEISFLDIEKRILKAEFVDEFLYVVLADRKILRYEILKVLDEIGLEELFDEYVPTIRKSFVTVKSSSVKQRSGTCLNSLDSLIVATDITLENFIFSCNSILAFKNETIVLINLRDIDTQKILSSFASIFSLKESEIITYADCKLLHLFKENEKITVSTVILSDN